MSGSSEYDQIFCGSLVNVSSNATAVGEAYKELISYSEKIIDIKDSKHLRLVSWNLLAPPYIRDKKLREAWRDRTKAQIELVGLSNADVIGLQEFWVQNKEYMSW